MGGGTLTADDVSLKSVRTARWAGFVFVNFDLHAESLEDFLHPLPRWLDPLDIQGMRYKWRKWTHLPCNWKVAVEGFMEGYHTAATHPQVLRIGGGNTISRAEGRHSCMTHRTSDGKATGTRPGTAARIDYRKKQYDAVKQQVDTVDSLSTDTLLKAAEALFEILPETADAAEVREKWLATARQIDLERGVIWPDASPQQMRDVGINWHVFPNSVLLPNVAYALGFRVRPHGRNPDSCIFEVYALERYPDGEEPRPENRYETELTEERWRLLLKQDFSNFAEVQKGMKSWGLGGLRPNPIQEQGVVHFQRTLMAYMNQGKSF